MNGFSLHIEPPSYNGGLNFVSETGHIRVSMSVNYVYKILDIELSFPDQFSNN